MQIVFFTSNVKQGGLDIENSEEIDILKTKYKIKALPFECIDNIVNILEDEKDRVYVDFTNSDLRKLNVLNTISNKIIFKYRGRYIDDNVLKYLSSFRNACLLTTSVNITTDIKCIRQWYIELDKPILPPTYLTYFKTYNDLQSVTSEYIYMYVGRSCSSKGINELVDAFIRLKDNSILILITIGTCVVEEHPNIYQFNNLSYNDCLHAINQFCDCLVMPSISEGFGRVAVEALNFNKVLISTKNTMLYEIIPYSKQILYIDDISQLQQYLIKARKCKRDRIMKHNLRSWLQMQKKVFIDIFK